MPNVALAINEHFIISFFIKGYGFNNTILFYSVVMLKQKQQKYEAAKYKKYFTAYHF